MRKRRVLSEVKWPTYHLNQVATRVTRRNAVGNANVLTVSARDGLIGQDGFFRRRVASSDTRNYYLLSPGDFVYNKSYSDGYPVGVVKSLKGSSLGIVSPLYICFKPDQAIIDDRYLEYYFDAGMANGEIEWIAKEGSRNHGLLNVGVADFMSITLCLPPIEEQRRIAEILDAADGRIATLLRLLRKQDTLRESLLCSLIPVLPEPQELGSGWILASLAEVVPSADYGISSPLTLDAVGIPTLRMNNLAFGRIKVDDLKFATTEIPSKLMLRARDVLFNRTNSFEHVGRTAIWRNELERATFASYLVRLNPDLRRLMPEYLVRWLNHPAVQQRIRRIATPGVQQVNINPTSLRKIRIELPTDVSRQAEIVQALDQCDRTVDRISAELTHLKLVKLGLMDDLLTGRVHVTSASL